MDVVSRPILLRLFPIQLRQRLEPVGPLCREALPRTASRTARPRTGSYCPGHSLLGKAIKGRPQIGHNRESRCTARQGFKKHELRRIKGQPPAPKRHNQTGCELLPEWLLNGISVDIGLMYHGIRWDRVGMGRDLLLARARGCEGARVRGCARACVGGCGCVRGCGWVWVGGWVAGWLGVGCVCVGGWLSACGALGLRLDSSRFELPGMRKIGKKGGVKLQEQLLRCAEASSGRQPGPQAIQPAGRAPDSSHLSGTCVPKLAGPKVGETQKGEAPRNGHGSKSKIPCPSEHTPIQPLKETNMGGVPTPQWYHWF